MHHYHPASRAATLAIASGLLALASALIAFQLLNHAQKYHQFVVGRLAWSGGSKAGEIFAALLFIVVIPAAYHLLRWGTEVYTLAGVGQQALVLLQVACVPGAIGVGRIVLDPGVNLGKGGWGGLGWLILSLYLLTYWLLLSIVMTIVSGRRARNGSVKGFDSNIPLLLLFLIPTFAGFSLLGITIALNRGLLYNPMIPAWPVGFAIAASVCIGFLLHPRSQAKGTQSRLWGRGVIYSQVGIPFLAAGLIPTPYVQHGLIERTAPIRPALILLVVSIGAIAMWEVLRRLRNASREIERVSPFALLLCAWIIKDSFTPLPTIPSDDWHFGEILLPFFSWYDFGAIPFANLMPVRGFISVTNAAVGNLFFDGTAADISHSTAIIGLLFSALVFFPMHLVAGPVAAALAALTLSNGNDRFIPIGQPDYLFAAAFCTIYFLAQRQRYDLAVMAWLMFDPLYFLLVPGYSLLFVAATIPLVGYCLSQAGASGIKRISMAFFGVGLTCLLALAVPTGAHIVRGIWYYLSDNASVHVISYGVPWGGDGTETPTVLELFRSSSLLIAAVLLTYCTGKLWRYRPTQLGGTSLNTLNSADRLDLVFSLSIVMTVIVFLPRVLGRIDPNWASRLGSLTLLVVGGLVPLVLRRYNCQTTIGLLVLLFAIMVSGINASLGSPLSPKALLMPQYVHAESQRLEDGNQLGLKHVGSAQFNPGQVERLVLLKQSIDSLLPSGTPYYDLSNRNAQYVYLGRPVPAEWSGPYYLADERAQERVVGELSSRKVPLFLLRVDKNIEYDGGSAALRAYWLYRFVLSNYIPFRFNGFIFAVRRDDAEQDGFKPLIAINPQQTMELLDEAFVVTNLRGIPISWGKSYDTLKSRLTTSHLKLVPSVGADGTILLNAPKALESSDHSTQDSHDLLRLRLECDRPAEPQARLTWNGVYRGSIITGELSFYADSGTLLVPIGAYSSWMLSERRSEITLNFSNRACRVLEAELLQRAVPSIQ